jgi:hypothetical protein
MPECFECGSPAEVDHHVVPRSRGGTKTVPLCGRCHGRAHHTNRNMAPGSLIKQGISRCREEGVWVGRPPYGYSVRRDGQLEEVPSEMAVLGVAALAREHGWTTERIAAALNRWGSRQRTGSAWSRARVWMLINRHRPRPTAKDPTPAPPPPVAEQRFLPGQKTLPIVEAL